LQLPLHHSSAEGENSSRIADINNVETHKESFPTEQSTTGCQYPSEQQDDRGFTIADINNVNLRKVGG
jgi:hypothetical protein